jgi:hypothetical protein
MADLYDDGIAQNTDIEYLKSVIQDLLSEKEIVRQRVTVNFYSTFFAAFLSSSELIF